MTLRDLFRWTRSLSKVRAVSDSDPDLSWRNQKSVTTVEVDRISLRVESYEQKFDKVPNRPRWDDSRVDEAHAELARSQAELNSVEERFNEVASSLPVEIGHLEERLSAILNSALLEAEQIRLDASRFAEAIRTGAEADAAKILGAAFDDRELAANLRAEVEAEVMRANSEIPRMREQAALDAAAIMAEAELSAEELLTAIRSDVDMRLAAAQERLNDLEEVRNGLLKQLTAFYDRLHSKVAQPEQVESVQAVSTARSLSAPPPSGRHAIP